MFRKLFRSSSKTASSPQSGSTASAPVMERLDERRLLSVSIQEVALPTATSGPQGITTGNDGNYYFAEQNTKLLGRLTPGGLFTEYGLKGTGNPGFVATGSDGNIYIGQTDGISIYSPRYQRVKTFLPTATAVSDLITGPDGALWYTLGASNTVVRLFPDSQKTTTLNVPSANADPNMICMDTSGSLWFTERNANKIGHIILKRGRNKIVEFAIPTAASGASGIVQGPDGDIWFAENSSNKLGRIDPLTGVILEFAVPTPNSGPLRVFPGADGSVFFSENLAGQVGQIFDDGTFSEVGLPTGASAPVAFTDASFGRSLLLTEHNGNNIAVLSY